MCLCFLYLVALEEVTEEKKGPIHVIVVKMLILIGLSLDVKHFPNEPPQGAPSTLFPALL